MAILQTLFAALARQAGRLINTVFGWATTTLFGKVPQERQTWLSVLALSSVAWLVVVIGVVFPKVGVFLLSFVTLPDWVNDNMIRLAMLAAALLLPLLVGFVSLKLVDPEDRPQGRGATFKALFRGYPSTLAISIALLMMIVFVPVMKVRTLFKRWTSEHLPMIVEEQDYMSTVRDIEAALDKAGFEVRRQPASLMLRLPLKVMTALSGRGNTNLIADNMTTLVSDRIELILHPSDLVINASKYDAAHARAVVAEQLSFSRAYLTWTKEANQMEDRLRTLWHRLRSRSDRFVPEAITRELQQFERDLQDAKIQHEEWEILFREKLLVERGLLQVIAGVTNRPKEPSETNLRELGSQRVPATPQGQSLRLLLRAGSLLAVAAMSWLARGRREEDGGRKQAPYTELDRSEAWIDERLLP